MTRCAHESFAVQSLYGTCQDRAAEPTRSPRPVRGYETSTNLGKSLGVVSTVPRKRRDQGGSGLSSGQSAELSTYSHQLNPKVSLRPATQPDSSLAGHLAAGQFPRSGREDLPPPVPSLWLRAGSPGAPHFVGTSRRCRVSRSHGSKRPTPSRRSSSPCDPAPWPP